MPYAIAIDGPSGVGKSTVARRLAKELQFIYVDTGAMYRGLGLYMTEHGIDPKDTERVIAALPQVTLSIGYADGEQRVYVNGEDVSGRIRTPAVSMAASAVSAIPAVRTFLLATQRDLAAKNDVIMDGRDIGTVILPDAQVKIFLTASPETRAKRRYADLQAKGDTTPFEAVLEDMKVRDYNDSHRAAAPLRPAEDAVTVDNSDETLDETVARIRRLAAEKIPL